MPIIFPQPSAISGKVTDNKGNDNLYEVVVVNERTSEGILASPGGAFSIKALYTDTILFTASGFMVKKVCLADSAYRATYYIHVRLDSLHLNLAEVKVYPIKSLREIDQARSSVGEIPNTDKYQNTHLLTSPISNLYERFSRIEQSKRDTALLADEDKKRTVLKELFQLYIKNDIINLDASQFDAFINYLNFSDYFIRTATDYDLIMAIKYRYEAYQNQNSYVPVK